jgi:AraC-like DNA-binding protein
MNYHFIIIGPKTGDGSKEDPEIKEIYNLLKQLFREYNKPAFFKKTELISSYLNILRIKTGTQNLPADAEGPYSREDYRYFQKFISALEHDLTDTHKVADYSKKIGITPRRLSTICQSCRGKSPKEIINEYLVAESRRLLLETEYPIKQIALQLGFADPYQFSKYFKKHEKASPSHFRKKRN